MASWQPSTQYPTGSLVSKASAPSPVAVVIPNNSFESGAVSWNFGGNIALDSSFAYQGTKSIQVNGTGTTYPQLSTALAVTVGQSITASCMYHQGGADAGDNKGRVCLIWYTSGLVEISKSFASTYITSSDGGWKKSTVTAVAPPTAAFVKIAGDSVKTDGGNKHNFDNFVWNHTTAGTDNGLIYKAVQSGTGTSGATEPSFPATLGLQVVDNTVTWEAVTASSVTWTASTDIISGGTEPTWVIGVGNFTLDGSMQWEAISNVVDDPKCPQKTVTAIGASKVFVGDDDITRFCATVNPLDWTSERDAGYIASGLQQAGANNVSVIGLYRQNLVIFNANCFQMWQIDPDPEAMALLDQMQGIGSIYQQAAQEVADELFFLSAQGVRTIGVSASSESLQSGDVGAPIDSLVVPSIISAVANGLVPRGTYYTGAGQYWLTGDTTQVSDNPSSPDDSLAGDVVSLLHFEGVDGGTNFDDELGNVWTRRNNAVLETTNAIVGVSSLNCLNGIRTTITEGGLLDISGTGNYCIEVKFRPTTIAGSQVLVCFNRTSAENPILRVQVIDGEVNFQTIGVGNNGVNFYHPTFLVANTNNTICIQRRGLDIYDIFVNGIKHTSGSYSGTSYANENHTHCYIGTDVYTWDGYQGNTAQGLVDEIRITKNFRYSADYTPSNEPFPLYDTYQNVFVYTQNQIGKMGSWSRYSFPYVIDGFATLGNKMYIRGNNGVADNVYVMDEDATTDDGVAIEGIVQWNWIDCGQAGITKMLETVDIVGTGTAPTISIGYDQTNPLAVTTPYQLQADSLSGMPVPIPVSAPTFSIKLEYPSGGWELQQFLLEVRPNGKQR